MVATKAEKTTKAMKAVWRPRLALKTTKAVKAERAKDLAEALAKIKAEWPALRRAAYRRAGPRKRRYINWWTRFWNADKLERRAARLQVHVDALMQRILDPPVPERRGVFIEDPDDLVEEEEDEEDRRRGLFLWEEE